mgnify:FL=1
MHWTHRSLCCLLVVSLSGCYAYSPYRPYGMGGAYPGVYSTPPAGGPMMAPGTTYAPGAQSFSPPVESYGHLHSGPWQPSQVPTNQPQNSGATATPPGSNGGNAVPDYEDPVSVPGAESDSDTQPADEFTSPFDQTSTTPGSTNPNGVELNGIEPAEGLAGEAVNREASAQPSNLRVASASRTLGESLEGPSPYGYDKNSYRWMRGIVDFDAEKGTWNLIYSLTPDASDQFGGSITLADDPRLASLTNEDVILVEGAVDASRPDGFGKPVYRVAYLARLVPKT